MFRSSMLFRGQSFRPATVTIFVVRLNPTVPKYFNGVGVLITDDRNRHVAYRTFVPDMKEEDSDDLLAEVIPWLRNSGLTLETSSDMLMVLECFRSLSNRLWRIENANEERLRIYDFIIPPSPDNILKELMPDLDQDQVPSSIH